MLPDHGRFRGGARGSGRPELPQWVELRRTRDRRLAQQLALVLASMNVEHGLFQQRGEMVLIVHGEDALRAADESSATSAKTPTGRPAARPWATCPRA
ncbi:MAG: hypothetical protein IPK67_14355 [Planctomycetes bacterium]|nr:hypothetical protein [Planctomycetota bacterium]